MQVIPSTQHNSTLLEASLLVTFWAAGLYVSLSLSFISIRNLSVWYVWPYHHFQRLHLCTDPLSFLAKQRFIILHLWFLA